MSDIEMYSVLTSGLREVVIRKFLIIVSARCTLVTEGGEESDQLTRLIRMFRSWKYCQRVKLNGMVHHTAQKKKNLPASPVRMTTAAVCFVRQLRETESVSE